MNNKFGLNKQEVALFRRLNTPRKIQDYISKMPINFELKGETYSSPRATLARNSAHCFEGALLAAAILWFHGQKPLLLDMITASTDVDHVVTLFKKNGHWGAISKTNHAVLRYREPIYKTVRELAMSYFHEYFVDSGYKTLREYSKPFDLSGSTAWITTEEDLAPMTQILNDSRHYKILTKPMIASLRRAEAIEREAGKIVQEKQPSSQP